MSPLGDHDFGQLEYPASDLKRLHQTGISIILLAIFPLSSLVLLAMIGVSIPAVVLAWSPLIAYLLISGHWALRQPGYYIGWNWPLDKVWSRYWIDEGNLEKRFDGTLASMFIPIVKMARWSYTLYYELPDGVAIGMSRLYGGRAYDIIMVHIEGVNEGNVDIAKEVHTALTEVDIYGPDIYAKGVPSSSPLECTMRG